MVRTGGHTLAVRRCDGHYSLALFPPSSKPTRITIVSHTSRQDSLDSSHRPSVHTLPSIAGTSRLRSAHRRYCRHNYPSRIAPCLLRSPLPGLEAAFRYLPSRPSIATILLLYAEGSESSARMRISNAGTPSIFVAQQEFNVQAAGP